MPVFLDIIIVISIFYMLMNSVHLFLQLSYFFIERLMRGICLITFCTFFANHLIVILPVLLSEFCKLW